MTVLDKTEQRDGLAVYWFVDETTGKRVYGVCFENGFFNIANQSLAESLDLAHETMADIVDAALNEESSKCGHSQRFIRWEDHSRPIVCTMCEVKRLESQVELLKNTLRDIAIRGTGIGGSVYVDAQTLRDKVRIGGTMESDQTCLKCEHFNAAGTCGRNRPADPSGNPVRCADFQLYAQPDNMRAIIAHEFEQVTCKHGRMAWACNRCYADQSDEVERLRAENTRLLELCQPISASQKEGEFWDAIEKTGCD